MIIASGGIQHETNSFSHVPTTLADFQRDSQCGPDFEGGDFLRKLYTGTAKIHGGYLAGANEANVDLRPLFCAHAAPAGLVAQSAFDTMTNLFLDRLKKFGHVDGIALDLHGAMATDDFEDAEGEFIRRVREQVGMEIPIVMTLDFHANITEQMAKLANVIIGYDSYPHVDMNPRGREAILLLSRIIRGEVTPCMSYCQVPLLTLPPKQCTLRDPMQSLMQHIWEMESRPGVLTATVAMGFPYVDIRDVGVSVLVTTDKNRELSERLAKELAQRMWDLRDELDPELTTIEEAIRYSQSQSEGLVIFADGSDNPGGGAPCDGTVALKALIDAKFERAIVGVMADPETVAQAHRAGVGATIPARIGGKVDNRHGATIEIDAYVKTLGDGDYIYQGDMMRGVRGNLGRMAVLIIGGVTVVLSENRHQLLDAEMLRCVGIMPERYRFLVVKSAVHFRADFGPMASAIFDADTPGIHRPDFSNYNYRRLRRPVYPLDRETKFSPQIVTNESSPR
ncbi:MAG: M81 family metallopeptidase [Planctomycetaceae bacterium]